MVRRYKRKRGNSRGPRRYRWIPPTSGTFSPDEVERDPRFPRADYIPAAFSRRGLSSGDRFIGKNGEPQIYHPYIELVKRDVPGRSPDSRTMVRAQENEVSWEQFASVMRDCNLVVGIDKYRTARLFKNTDRRDVEGIAAQLQARGDRGDLGLES